MSRWHSAANLGRRAKFSLGDISYDIRLQATQKPNEFVYQHEDQQIVVSLLALSQATATISLNGVTVDIPFHRSEHSLSILWRGQPYYLIDSLHDPQQGAAAVGTGQIRAPMDGAVVDILCESQQSVSKGTTLAILEAMKMEHPIKADKDGIVNAVHIQVGDQVKTRHLLIEIADSDG